MNDGDILKEGQNQRMLDSLDGPITSEELVAAIKATKANTARGLDGISLRDLETMNQNRVLTILNGMME